MDNMRIVPFLQRENSNVVPSISTLRMRLRNSVIYEVGNPGKARA
jgi:hypothetical protein